MKKRNRNIFEIKRGILKCKKRLDALKNQGFIFSQDIYDNLDSLEKKIIESSLIHQIWNKKLPLLAGIICILFIVAMIIIDNSNDDNEDTDGLMNIMIHNISKIIKEDYCIQGTANHSNGDIASVQVKIDMGNWEHATGTSEWEYWEYWIYIDDFSEGPHNLSFQCWDGIKYSDITNYTIKIQKPRIVKPVVAIHNPSNGDDVSGIKNINGNATGGNGEIQRVEIRFNEGQWINVTGKTTWTYNWDTTTIENESYYISVRSYDKESHSDIVQIHVTVHNDDEPDNQIELPPFSDEGYFQLFMPSNNELIKPDRTYIVQGYHRRKYVSNFQRFYTVKTILEVGWKPDWLNVSLPKQPLVTPPDGKTYNFSIYISITNDAPTNIKIPFTITYTYGIYYVMSIPFLAQLQNPEPYDVTIFTGKW